MGERPATGIGPTMWGGWTPSGWVPWGKSLWGTTIDYGQGAKLVIDKDGVGHFTDPAGETGTWNPTMFGWQDEDGAFMEPTFGLPGMDVETDQAESVIESLVGRAEELRQDQPGVADMLYQRAQDLWERWHNVEVNPFPY